MQKVPAFIVVAGLLAGCAGGAGGSAPEGVEPEGPVAQTQQAMGKGCPTWGCGENSPLLGPYAMEELEETGLPNKDKVRLLGFHKGSTDYDADVRGDKLYALDRATHNIALSGFALQGGALMVEVPSKDPAHPDKAEIRITNVSQAIQFWVGPTQLVETYELDYTGIDTPVKEYTALCKDPPPPYKGRIARVEGHLTDRYEAILFTGDRYDAERKLVTASSYGTAGNWFNIACAGGALLKLHLNRHTTASQASGYVTNTAQRQTMLKMYTGDFCGTGQSFTEQGTKIHWDTKTGLTSGPGNDTSYESLWNKDGAVCLTTHRLNGISTAPYQKEIQGNGTSEYPGICPKKSCSDVSGFPNMALTGGYIVTQSTALP